MYSLWGRRVFPLPMRTLTCRRPGKFFFICMRSPTPGTGLGQPHPRSLSSTAFGCLGTACSIWKAEEIVIGKWAEKYDVM